jgi:hypothetical protein
MSRAMAVGAVAVLILVPVAGFGQYYWYNGNPNPYYGGQYYGNPYYGQPSPYGQWQGQPNAQPRANVSPQTPQRYYLWRPPDAATIQRWNQHNRMLDQDQLMRSPGNPESPLEYMLRTF